MAPTCSNCGGYDFVWANEVKTGSSGGGLSLRAKGEAPIGTRVCKGCGHADLFLHDLELLRKPHLWMPGEFYPITGQRPPEPSPAPRAPDPTPSPPMPAEPMRDPAPIAPAAPGPIAAPSEPAPPPVEVAAESNPGKGRPGRRRAAKAAGDTA